MKTHFYSKCSFVLGVLFLWTTSLSAQVVPTITGPAGPNMVEYVGTNTLGAIYTTEANMTNYLWAVSPQGNIVSGQGTNTVTVDWTNVVNQQWISVTYTENTAGTPTVLFLTFYPFLPALDPTLVAIPKFVDGLPHFAAGLRVNARNGGNLTVKTGTTQQVALPTGTVLNNGTIGDPNTPNAGLGNYVGYSVSYKGGSFSPPMWPAFTIEAQQGKGLTVTYLNELYGVKYSAFNILADQTLMMNGYPQAGVLTGNPATDPYDGPIPMVVHLHGGEMPSGSDGGPSAWFMPGGSPYGPTYQVNQSSVSTYPNMQEETTLWYHPHDDGLTRINVYTGLAGYYFLRGPMEEAAKLPGWTGDDLVQEVAPAGKNQFPLSATPYLPEVEIAIQDRMFNINGELYWPVAPPNPDIHPYWTPEFVGDIMTVNGKAWPYLSVAPRKYRFRLLEGCNARFLNLWLEDAANGNPGPVITVVGAEGGLLQTPIVLDPSKLDPLAPLGDPNPWQTLLMAPGQRYDVVIDFSGLAGKTFTLRNDANAPYPGGDPVIAGVTDQIMQFVVSGQMVAAGGGTPGDKSLVPSVLRPSATPLVQLTDFAGTELVKPLVHRQLILNEVSGAGGPASVQVNNSYFESSLSINPNDPYRAGGPTEFQLEGTVEKVEIINVSADAHPLHIHLLQWQLVSRQAIDFVGYLNAYGAAWHTLHPGVADFPAGLGYPGGAGPPYPYNRINADGAIGGNPEVSPFLVGGPIPANPEERSWKDNVIVLPGQVTTFLVRVAPTDRPVNATPQQLLFPFDPSLGPGYVVHCHIIDHEDMSMMRPLMILPSALRFPQISAQPANKTACAGDAVSFSVTATSATPITYQWQISNDAGLTWTNIVNGTPYSGALTATLGVSPAVPPLSGNMYRCNLTNVDGTTTSNAATLTITVCRMRGRLRYNNNTLDLLTGFTVSVNGVTSTTDAAGLFDIGPLASGTYPVIITTSMPAGGINATDAAALAGWAGAPVSIKNVNFLSGDGDNDMNPSAALDAPLIQQNFVMAKPFIRSPWSFHQDVYGNSCPSTFNVTINGTSVEGFEILARATGDFNGSYTPNVPGTSSLILTQSGHTLTVPAALPFNLSVNVPLTPTYTTVSAISLILNVPSTLVTVNSVKVQGSTTPAAFSHNAATGELRIGWNSTTPLAVVAGQPLVVINMTPTAAFTNLQIMTVTMVSSYLNELADGTLAPIINGELIVDNVTTSTSPTVTNPGLKLAVAPNPATTTITITFQLPADGTVTLGVYGSKGTAVLPPILTNVSRLAGNYSMTVNVSSLMKGSYYVRLTEVSAIKTFTTSLKFMKK